MSKVEELQVFVMARLDSTAEEIPDYCERMVAENKEELRRSEEENQRKQSFGGEGAFLSPKLLLHRLSPDIIQGLPQDFAEPPQIKEEPEWSIKQEEEELM